MNWFLWIGGGVLILAIIAAIFFFARNPKWVAGLVKSFVAMAINAFLPVLAKRMPPDEEAAWNKFMKTNPDKYEIAKWRKEYRKRQKVSKSSA